MQKTRKPQPTHSVAWHKEHCPCGGKPQPVSRRLADRIKETPHNVAKMHFNKPGSQNRKK